MGLFDSFLNTIVAVGKPVVNIVKHEFFGGKEECLRFAAEERVRQAAGDGSDGPWRRASGAARKGMETTLVPACVCKCLSGAAAAVVALAGLVHPAYGWNAGGHMMVAQIAYERLSPYARGEADRLLAVPLAPLDAWRQAQDFVNAAHWADDVRRSPGFEATAVRHFIDYPLSPDGTPPPPDEPGADNIVTALQDHVRVLRSDADAAQKALALRFVLHFAGDIHQPLHCATRVTADWPKGDHGGNDFSIAVRDPAGGAPVSTRLHAYWDSGMGAFPQRPAGATTPALDDVRAAAAQALADAPAGAAGWQAGGPAAFERWAQESRQIAADFVYAGLAENREPPDGYRAQALRIARQRVAWAGHRLAELLNAIFTPRQTRFEEDDHDA